MELVVALTQDRSGAGLTTKYTVRCAELDMETIPSQYEFPLKEEDLDEIRWYLEIYSQWPMAADQPRAWRLASNLQGLGNRLWDSLFEHPAAQELYHQFVAAPGDKVLTIASPDPGTMSLPWELMADKRGYLFTQNPPISMRRQIPEVASRPPLAFDLPLRVLIVACQPTGCGPIGLTSGTTDVLDALEPVQGLVQVEFLRPPTFAALGDRLRFASGLEPHILHLDLLAAYSPGSENTYFLFEDDNHCQQPVDGDQLGRLVKGLSIPLTILATRGHGRMRESLSLTRLAMRLIESGMGSVLAMNYSATVDSVRQLVTSFYYELAQGRSVGQALAHARCRLFNNPVRASALTLQERGEETSSLLDCFAPVLYQQMEDVRRFRATPHSGSTRTGTLSSESWRIPRVGERRFLRPFDESGFPPEPRYGFQGRTSELLTVERALSNHRIVVIHGFGGQGKTALATRAAARLTQAGQIQRTIYHSFEKGGSLQAALFELLRALETEEITGYTRMSEEDQIRSIRQWLGMVPTLVVWDHIESILPSGEAALDSIQLHQLFCAAAELTSVGSTRLLVVMRNPSLPSEFSDLWDKNSIKSIELEGLSESDALDLATQILRTGGTPEPERSGFLKLVRFLAGHPLSIELVLLHVPWLDIPEVMLSSFDRLLPEFSQSQVLQRNDSLIASLEVSVRCLDPKTRALIAPLGVFSGVGSEVVICQICGYEPHVWQSIRRELEQAALIAVEGTSDLGMIDPHNTGILKAPFIRFHPTLAPYLASRLDDERRREYETRFLNVYRQLAFMLDQKDRTRDANAARRIAAQEMPNFKQALVIACLRTPTLAQEFEGWVSRFLRNAGLTEELSRLEEFVAATLQSVVSSKDSSEAQRFSAALVLRKRDAEWLFNVGRPEDSLRANWENLQWLQLNYWARDAQDRDPQIESARALWNIGRCLVELGRPSEAERPLNEALSDLTSLPIPETRPKQTGFLRQLPKLVIRGSRSMLSTEKNNECEGPQHLASSTFLDEAARSSIRRLQGNCYCSLGDALRDLGRFDEAEESYKRALNIDSELDYPRGQAYEWLQLGALYSRTGRQEQAQECTQDAADVFVDLDEPFYIAIAMEQLSEVGQRAQDRVEIEEGYRACLTLMKQTRNHPGIVRVFRKLGNIAANDGRLEDAETWYRAAIEAGEQGQLYAESVKCLTDLAELLLRKRQLDAADHYVRQALEIIANNALGTTCEPWKTYHVLANVAKVSGHPDEVRSWTRQEQDIYAAYAGSTEDARKWSQEINAIVSASRELPGSNESFPALARVVDTSTTVILWNDPPRASKECAIYQAIGGLDRDQFDPLMAAFRSIIAGERDLETLRMDLTRQHFAIISRLLEQIGEAERTRDQFASLQGAGIEGPLRSKWRFLVPMRRRLQQNAEPQTLVQKEVVTRTEEPPTTRRSSLRIITLDELLSVMTPASEEKFAPELALELEFLIKLMTNQMASIETQELGRAIHTLLTGAHIPELPAASILARWPRKSPLVLPAARMSRKAPPVKRSTRKKK